MEMAAQPPAPSHMPRVLVECAAMQSKHGQLKFALTQPALPGKRASVANVPTGHLPNSREIPSCQKKKVSLCSDMTQRSISNAPCVAPPPRRPAGRFQKVLMSKETEDNHKRGYHNPCKLRRAKQRTEW